MKLKRDARLVSILLVAICVILIAGTIAGFVIGLGSLGTLATATDRAKIDAQLATDELETITRLKKFIDNNPELVAKTDSVISSAQQFQYQDDVLNDIQRIANESGVRVQSFTFTGDEQATLPTPGVPVAQQPIAVPGLNLSPTLPAGVKTASATVTLGTPLNYQDFLRFIKRIERSPTQFNVQPMTLQVDAANRSSLQSTTVELKVFTK